MESKQMIIVEPDGTEIEVEVITSFYNDKKSKQYIMYSKGEKQGDNTIVYVSIVNKTGGQIVLDDIESDEEWASVKGIIKDLLSSK